MCKGFPNQLMCSKITLWKLLLAVAVNLLSNVMKISFPKTYQYKHVVQFKKSEGVLIYSNQVKPMSFLHQMQLLPKEPLNMGRISTSRVTPACASKSPTFPGFEGDFFRDLRGQIVHNKLVSK